MQRLKTEYQQRQKENCVIHEIHWRPAVSALPLFAVTIKRRSSRRTGLISALPGDSRGADRQVDMRRDRRGIGSSFIQCRPVWCWFNCESHRLAPQPSPEVYLPDDSRIDMRHLDTFLYLSALPLPVACFITPCNYSPPLSPPHSLPPGKIPAYFPQSWSTCRMEKI